MSPTSRSAAPAKVTGSTAVIERLGTGPVGGDEVHGLTRRVDGSPREGLEAGEQHGRHPVSLRGVR